MASYNEGTFTCRVTGQFFSTAGKNSTPFFGIEVLPITEMGKDGAYDLDSKFTRTVKLWVNSEANIDRTVERLRSIGWTGEKFTELEPEGDFSLIGTEIELVNSHDNGPDGKVWDNFDFPYTADPTISTVENDSSIAKKLDRLYRPKGGTTTTATTKKTAKVSDEEVPF